MGMMTVWALIPAAWDHGDMMDNGGGTHWVWAVLMAVMAVIVIAFLATLLWLVARRPSDHAAVHPTHGAREILAERMARGDITPEEYQERLRALG
jgi:putative membrane protein